MNIQIQYNDQQVQTAFSKLIAAGSDLTDVMNVVAHHLESGIKDAFESQQSPDGQPWAPLSAKTIAQKNKRGQSSNKLVAEGALSSRILADWGSNYAAAGTNAVAGNNNFPYGAVHQFGSDAKNIPARPFLGVSAKNEQNIQKSVTDFIADQWR